MVLIKVFVNLTYDSSFCLDVRICCNCSHGVDAETGATGEFITTVDGTEFGELQALSL